MTLRNAVLTFAGVFLLWAHVPLAADRAVPAPPDRLRVLFFNANNYRIEPPGRHKSERSLQAVADTLAHWSPHIAVLAEIADQQSLDDLLKRIEQGETQKTYAYARLVKGHDSVRHLAVLSTFPSPKERHDTTTTYNIRDVKVPVRRGFAHCVFEWSNGYTLHVLGAHLKSKVYHRLGQTDMRRYEGRQLRYRVNDILEENPHANVLVVGDMNDSPQSSPIKTIIYRRFGTEKELFDLRPADSRSMLWTHYWDDEDIYARIDYAFATYHLLPEVNLEDTVVAMVPYWRLASDHRPLLITIRPEDRAASREMLDGFYRNFRCHFYKDPDSEPENIAPQAR